MLDLPTDDMAAAEAARPRPQGGTQSVWMLLEVVMFERMAMARYVCATVLRLSVQWLFKACYTAGRADLFLAPGTLRLLFFSAGPLERVEEDAMGYLAAPEPNRRAGGMVR